MKDLRLEPRVTLEKAISSFPEYSISGSNVYFRSKKVAEFYRKSSFYNKLLKPKGINYSSCISNKLLPKESLLILKNKMLYITDTKFQKTEYYVYRKLQTCDFKKKQYSKLLEPLGISVKYVYILSDWFKKEQYKDVLGYVKSVGCYYFFYELPLSFLGLPEPSK